MKRRRFQKMLFFAGITASPFLGARAQPKSKLRIGCVLQGASGDDKAAGFRALFERLGEHGYVEGRNLEVDFVLAPYNHDFLASYNAFVKRGADLLVVLGSDIPLLAARIAAAGRVPIVIFATDYDPLEAGYIESLARPGGNLTGVFIRQSEMIVKQVELVRELFPDNRRLIVWAHSAVMQQADAAQRAAQSFGLDVQLLKFDIGTLELMFQRIQSLGSAPTLFPSNHWFRLNRDMICRMALERRIPLIAPQREFVEAGALISYGARLDDAYRLVADYISRIADGAKPAVLPIEQPARYELSVNRRTARELGIALSPVILARADEVIE
jgi:putative ABC transport system substrate-binding protein